MRLLGIDFGARMAGTTVGCVLHDREVRFERCPKGTDADEFVLKLFAETRPTLVGIDAPLSLPAVYRSGRHSEESDYFYRASDRELRAMSPLFLGGMTARAIRLKAWIERRGSVVIEVYPAALLREIGNALEGYSKERCSNQPELLEEAIARIARWGQVPPACEPRTWHDVDSFLALVSTVRYLRGTARTVGEPDEGLIIV